MTVLAPSERYYEKRGRKPKTITERAQQMIFQLRRWLPDQTMVMVGDKTYAALELLAACQALLNPVIVVTRLRMDAALYEPAPPYAGRGRPRKKGKRLPTPQQVLDSPKTIWTTIEMLWYDGQKRMMEMTSGAAVWYHTGKPPVPIRWVLIRDPQDEYDTICLLCTDPEVAPPSKSQNGLSYVGNSKSLSRNLAAIWVWKPNANGPTRPSLERLLCCWVSFLGLPWLLMPFIFLDILSWLVSPPGTLSPYPLSLTLWLWCVNYFGLPGRLFEHWGMTLTS